VLRTSQYIASDIPEDVQKAADSHMVKEAVEKHRQKHGGGRVRIRLPAETAVQAGNSKLEIPGKHKIRNAKGRRLPRGF